tara:strand:- start:27 stop:335 length:309 start_codon:yes stop_codon:yes gene_type:complete
MIEIIGMEDNYRPLPSNLTIKLSDIEGFGIFAIDDIKKQTNLGLSHLILDEEIIRTPLGGFINHSDNPNCQKVETDNKFYLHTITDIKNGEELTLKYTFYKL